MIHLSHGIIRFSLLILFVSFLYKNVLIIKTKLRVSESLIKTCQYDCYSDLRCEVRTVRTFKLAVRYVLNKVG